MRLTKKQIKAFLETMGKEDTRPQLCEAIVSEFAGDVFLVATNSHTLTAILLDKVMAEHVGKVITRDSLIRWYKLASNKDSFNEAELRQHLVESGYDFPDWQSLMPTEKQQVAHYEIAIDPAYWLAVNTIEDDAVTLVAYEYSRFVGYGQSGNQYIICGLRQPGYTPYSVPVIEEEHEAVEVFKQIGQTVAA